MIWIARMGIVVIALAWKLGDAWFWVLGKLGKRSVVREAQRAQAQAQHPSGHHMVPPLAWLDNEDGTFTFRAEPPPAFTDPFAPPDGWEVPFHYEFPPEPEDEGEFAPWGEDWREFYMQDPDNGSDR